MGIIMLVGWFFLLKCSQGLNTGETRVLRPHVRGQVFFFDFERPQNEAVPVRITSESLDLESFNPGGIDSYVNKDGKCMFASIWISSIVV